jgi:hypothetical protein
MVVRICKRKKKFLRLDFLIRISNNISFFNLTDPNSNNNKLTSGTDQNILPHTSNWPLQQSSNNQTNTLSSSSHQNL